MLGPDMPDPFLDMSVSQMRALLEHLTDSEIARQYGKSRHVVRKQRALMGIPSWQVGHPLAHPWSAARREATTKRTRKMHGEPEGP